MVGVNDLALPLEESTDNAFLRGLREMAALISLLDCRQADCNPTVARLSPDYCPTDRVGLPGTATFTAPKFFGIFIEQRWPGSFLFITDLVDLNASTHQNVVFRSGIAPRRLET